MKTLLPIKFVKLAVCFFTLIIALHATAQPGRERPPQFVSPDLSQENQLTFRIHAPEAKAVRLSSSDLPQAGRGMDMAKNDEGVWEITLESIDSGAYRYNFNVDGLAVIDPRNPITSESNMNAWSLVYVPGADFTDTNDVPHGAISTVAYFSKSLDRFRRMHIYTPPGYESGKGTYPIFYLLHGAFDSDNSWSTVGRAGFILDNLIAEKKAKPMVVAMPAGHTGPFSFGSGLPMDEFITDFNNDIKPFVESHYRIHADRKNRAIAGLSMGGAHTLGIAIPNLKDYGYIGVYSSGIFGINGRGPGSSSDQSFEEKHKDILDDAKLKESLSLFWFATGKDDFLLDTTKATVDMFKKHEFNVIYKETEGGHTWINWRDYLNEFAPLLFQ